MFRDACWFDWEVHIASMRRLFARRFSWILPGHGRCRPLSEAAMRAQVERCVAGRRGAR